MVLPWCQAVVSKRGHRFFLPATLLFHNSPLTKLIAGIASGMATVSCGCGSDWWFAWMRSQFACQRVGSQPLVTSRISVDPFLFPPCLPCYQVSAGQPFDTIKTRVQFDSRFGRCVSVSGATFSPSPFHPSQRQAWLCVAIWFVC